MKAAALAIALVLLATPAAAQSTLTGEVTHVRDGDTIEVGDVAVRFAGVSAPEMNERRGQESRRFMLDLVAGKLVMCQLTGKRSYDRKIGTCYLDGEDIEALIVAAGLARDCPRFSGGKYARFETPESKRLPFPKYCEQR